MHCDTTKKCVVEFNDDERAVLDILNQAWMEMLRGCGLLNTHNVSIAIDEVQTHFEDKLYVWASGEHPHPEERAVEFYKIICNEWGHEWENIVTEVPVRAGPLMRTICKRCLAIGAFPDNHGDLFSASPETTQTNTPWVTDVV